MDRELYNDINDLYSLIDYLERELEENFKKGLEEEADLIAEELYVARKELKTKEEQLHG